MELSTNLGYPAKVRGTDERRAIKDAAKIVKEAGFNYVDFGVARLIREENWQDLFKKAREDVESEGLVVNQTHAPYNFDNFDDDEYKELMKRSFEASCILGAEHIVIHADNYVPGEKGFDFETALKTICDFYSPFIEYAKKVNLRVAVENLFEVRQDSTRSRFTSYVEEQLAVIGYFKDPIVTACWDFGHGQVSYGDKHMEALKKIAPYLTSTHVHDSLWGKDSHNVPFHGNVPWEEVMPFMKEIGYTGKFTMEMVYGDFPDELLPVYMKLWFETGKYLVNL